MSFSKKLQKNNDLSLSIIENEILLIKKELFNLRLKKGTRQTFKSHEFKKLNHRLAQFKFLEGQKPNN
jgi:large subunit ribosomal protein L29